MTQPVLWALAAAGLLALALLWKPLKFLLRLALRTALGGGLLALLQPLGGLVGVQLGVNLCNALVLGVLGVPGLGLLLLLNWLVSAS